MGYLLQIIVVTAFCVVLSHQQTCSKSQKHKYYKEILSPQLAAAYEEEEDSCGSCTGSPSCEIEDNDKKYDIYKECMARFKIDKWKIVDIASNATYYKLFNLHNNLCFNPTAPIALFTPLTVTDVQATIKCGFKANIQVYANSGAHSYAYLSHGNNNSIILDFRYMNSIEINEAKRTVVVQPAVIVGHLNSKLWKNGGWGVGVGNCMTVGMGGHAVGGGIGYWASHYGLAMDNVVEYKVVDAAGNALTVNSDENKDLWWAVRGMGPGMIVIVTSIEFKMFKAIDIKPTFIRLRYPLEKFQHILASLFKWLDWVKQHEPLLSTIIFAVNDKFNLTNGMVGQILLHPGVEVQILHIEDPVTHPKNSTAILRAIISGKHFPQPVETVITNPSYIEHVINTGYIPVVRINEDLQADLELTYPELIEHRLNYYPTLNKSMARPGFDYYKSFFVKDYFEFEEFDEIQKVVNEMPNNINGIMITSEMGAIAKHRPTEMAYVHRDALFNVRPHVNTFTNETFTGGHEWVEKFYKTCEFMNSGQTYQNYPDFELDDYLNRYYGQNLWRLKNIKKKWDPHGYFNTKMSIPSY